MRDIDWEDLRHVLALVQHPTMAAAAMALRVHQTTLSRRIAALERQLDMRLFDRSGNRFSATHQGLLVARRAQEMDAASRALHDDLSHEPAHGPAVVRLSVIQTFVTGFLFRHLPAFADRWPEFQWIAANVPREHVPMTVNGGPAYTELVGRGNGVGLLTCIEGDARADLKRLSGPKPLIVREIWLLVLPEQRRNSAVRKVIDWLASVTRREAGLLAGTSPIARGGSLPVAT